MGFLPWVRTLFPGYFLFLFFILSLTFPAFAQSAEKGNEFADLGQRLIKDGFAPEQIKSILASEAVFFNPEGVSMFFVHSESSLNYDQFLSKTSIANAFQYMETHQETLDQAQKIYGVDKTVITAILLVETRLGTFLGKRTVINTLATMAALTDENLQERIWDAIPEQKKPEKETFLKKVQQRSKWGYEELKALIKYTERENLSPESLKGSYAGAMGISQFMPSNALTLARDGNNDGRIDLFHHSDAIFSVANYLKHHGWEPGISRQRQHEVLFRYNHSNYYVDTLMKISDRLKEG
ncbi:MAG TPA: lytic murein transglycosylase [Desulfotignum sp.]|nr:lytic murein transglycosylase [Desulfotignum sp.]